MIKIAITGAAGRMGRRIAALAIESEQFDIVSASDIAGHPALGRDIGELAGVGAFGVVVGDEITETPQVLIDFSLPEGTMKAVESCRDHGSAMVIGTTGFTESQDATIADAAAKIAVVKAGNFSMGINLLCKLVATAAKALGDQYDIELTETHHRFKKDAPSGTAIMLAKSACDAMGKEYGDIVTFGRAGMHQRTGGEIGMHSIRLGDTVGEHSVHFGNLGETITLSHSAHTRDTFARGALRAAGWVAEMGPGLYDMQDVLKLK